MKIKTSIALALVAASVATAQDFSAEDQTPSGKFLTAGEIKMITTATKPGWIGVRNWDGQDLIYFTNLLSWRCGMHQIEYAVNGLAFQVLDMEPCYAEEPAPNALKMETLLPYVALAEDSVINVTVRIVYDDMSTDEATYERAAVQMP